MVVVIDQFRYFYVTHSMPLTGMEIERGEREIFIQCKILQI